MLHLTGVSRTYAMNERIPFVRHTLESYASWAKCQQGIRFKDAHTLDNSFVYLMVLSHNKCGSLYTQVNRALIVRRRDVMYYVRYRLRTPPWQDWQLQSKSLGTPCHVQLWFRNRTKLKNGSTLWRQHICSQMIMKKSYSRNSRAWQLKTYHNGQQQTSLRWRRRNRHIFTMFAMETLRTPYLQKWQKN